MLADSTLAGFAAQKALLLNRRMHKTPNKINISIAKLVGIK
jgi:hypothetical protein